MLSPLVGSCNPRLFRARRRAFTLVELLIVVAIISLLAAIIFPVFGSVREKARRTTCMSNLKEIGMAVNQYAQDYDDRLPTIYYINGPTFELRNTFNLGQTYIKNEQVFYCPSDAENADCLFGADCSANGKEISYGFNMGPAYHENVGESMGGVSGEHGHYETQDGVFVGFYIGASLAELQSPSTTFLGSDAYDGAFHSMDPTAYFRVQERVRQSEFTHQNWRSVLFADGHVKSVQWVAGMNDNNSNPMNGGGLVMLPKDTALYKSYCADPDKIIKYEGQPMPCGQIAGEVAKTVTRYLPE